MLAVCNYVTSRLKLFLIVLYGIIFIYISLLWTSDILIKEHNYSAFCSIAREKCMQHSFLYKNMENPVPQLTGSQAGFGDFFPLRKPLCTPPPPPPPNHWLAPTSGKAPFGVDRNSDACVRTMLMAASHWSSGDCLRVSAGIKAGSSFGSDFSDFSFKLSLKASRKVVLLLTWKTTDLVPGEKESWGVTSNAWDVKPSSYLLEWLFP